MCAILDANALAHVFGQNRPAAGQQFLDWLETGRARLVVGGKLYEELAQNSVFEGWVETAIADGRVQRFPREIIKKETDSLVDARSCKSNDEHVIALARVSKARILYSDDAALRADFKNGELIANPRGRIYPTGQSDNARRSRRKLLSQTDFCPNR